MSIRCRARWTASSTASSRWQTRPAGFPGPIAQAPAAGAVAQLGGLVSVIGGAGKEEIDADLDPHHPALRRGLRVLRDDHALTNERVDLLARGLTCECGETRDHRNCGKRALHGRHLDA